MNVVIMPAKEKATKDRYVFLEMLGLTELKLARRFMQLEQNDGNWIYNKTRKKWMFWNQPENIWVEDTEIIMYKKIAEFVENLSMELNYLDFEDKEWAKIERFIEKTQSSQGLRNIENCCMAEARLITENDLDSDPYLVNFKNGIYNLETNDFYPASRENRAFYMTKRCEVDYIEGRTCDLWKKTLNEIFLNDQDYIDYIQRIFGYALLGKDKNHALFLIQGEGRNGKGTFFHIIRKIMGMYYHQVPTKAFTRKGKDTDLVLAELYGMRFALVSETEKGDELAESLLKNISGGDMVSGRRHHELYFQYQPQYKVFIETNHLPVINDQATWERMHTIKFERYFKPEERDENLRDKLEKELSGILLWLLDGWKKYQERGLIKPEKAIIDTQAHKDEHDILKHFLNDNFNLTVNEDDYIMGDTLFEIYKKWADQNQLNSKDRLNGIQFGKEIKKRKEIIYKSKRLEVDGKKIVRKVYVGMERITTRG